MVNLLPWIERRWSFTLPVEAFPEVLERLVGTPARAAALVAGVPEPVLQERLNGKWSVKEHFGHLSDLHPLDMRRVGSNRGTEEANHVAAPIDQLLQTLRDQRQQLLATLEALTETEVAATARHPRLGCRMRLIDWAQFVADHDDHHLAAARMAPRLGGVAGRLTSI
jgi:hypothetical protein